ncbi:MAG: hypothetical protein CME65_14585 [Halobacteriovoraceae bacterium]|nr:hypothetical protein [Halobacteriovoraceae bacterium]|tara:strand:- start:6839 stop:7486 length:648 start_codon:yes stop_codon:yes gene_type:complete
MKITLFGASGKVGQQVIKQAASRGHSVQAVVRKPMKGTFDNGVSFQRLNNFEDVDKLQKICENSDAVISCIGPQRSNPSNPWSEILTPNDFMDKFSNALIQSIITTDKRLVFLSAAGVGDSLEIMNPILKFVFFNSNVGISYKDLGKMESNVKNSDLNWTIVRPTTLSSLEMIKPIKHTDHYGLFNNITRASVAQFLLDCAESSNFLRECPIIKN